MGVEPTSSAWKAEVLPLNYTRRFCLRATFYSAQKILTVSIRQTVGIFNNLLCTAPKSRHQPGYPSKDTLHRAVFLLYSNLFKQGQQLNCYTCLPQATVVQYLVEGVGFEPT